MAVKTFSAGEQLTASDTNTYLANSGLVYITNKTLTGTSVVFTSGFSSTYDAYRVVVTGAKCSSSARFVEIKLGPTGGSLFYWTHVSAGTAWAFATGSADSVWRTGVVVDSTNAAGGIIDIYNPYSSVSASFQSSGTDPRTAGDFIRLSSGWHNSTSSFADLTVTLSGGDSFGAGTATLYGYRKA